MICLCAMNQGGEISSQMRQQSSTTQLCEHLFDAQAVECILGCGTDEELRVGPATCTLPSEQVSSQILHALAGTAVQAGECIDAALVPPSETYASLQSTPPQIIVGVQTCCQLQIVSCNVLHASGAAGRQLMTACQASTQPTACHAADQCVCLSSRLHA
jgi:hypothetical protein